MKQRHWVALQTLWVKEATRFLRIWVQTLVPPVITMALYFVIFGNLIGSQIGDMDGFAYITYIVPGLIMMAVITNSYSNVSSSFFSIKFQKSIEELLVAPVPDWVLIAGFVGGGVLRGLLVGLIVTLVALFFTALPLHHLGVVMLTVLLTATLFSLGGMINAIYARSFDDISIVPTFVLTPLTYLGGVFYSINLLPPLWQGVSQLNPILYMINAFRYGFLGVADMAIGKALAVLLVSNALLLWWLLRLLKSGRGLRS
jgi:ABC-2 type transport system permease protein